VFLTEKAKICRFDFRKFCIHPESNSCRIFDSIFGVSTCRLYRGGDANTPRKVVDGVKPLFSKHLKGGSVSR
jgi:hypothetical protein